MKFRYLCEFLTHFFLLFSFDDSTVIEEFCLFIYYDIISISSIHTLFEAMKGPNPCGKNGKLVVPKGCRPKSPLGIACVPQGYLPVQYSKGAPLWYSIGPLAVIQQQIVPIFNTRERRRINKQKALALNGVNLNICITIHQINQFIINYPDDTLDLCYFN